MSSIRSRLLANAGATTLGKALPSAIQIVSVPVLLQHWGASLYGEWLLLSAVPAYFAISDIGFGNVAGNEMTMLVAAGDRDEALEVFQSVSLFVTSTSILICAALASGIWFLPIDRWLQIRALSLHSARVILLLLGISTLLTLQEGLFQGAFRCVGKYALGIAVKSIVMACAFAGVVVAVVSGASPQQTAVVVLLINVAGTFVLWRILRTQIGWIRYGTSHARLSTIRRLFWSAVSFMCIPVSNIISLQGLLILVGHAFGPVGVVIFSTARVITRSVYQTLGLINNSVWPEISTAYGAGSISLVRKLHRTSCQISILVCIGITGALALFGNRVWSAWTASKVETDPVLLYILLLQMLIASLWYTSSVVAMATNQHGEIAKVIFGGSCLALVLAYFLMEVPSIGIRGAGAGLVIADVIVAGSVLRTSLGLVEDTIFGFVRSMLGVPRLLPRRR